MAAAPSFSQNRKYTDGYFKVPNSFAENQHLLKLPASRELALIYFRRTSTGDFSGTTTVSDGHWADWTGLAPRQKDYAIKELSAFGFNVEGRGNTAKFSWNGNAWRDRVLTHEPVVYDPKRKEREARAQQNRELHPDCAKSGCQMLCEGKENVTSQPPFLVTKIAQPVARTPKPKPEPPEIKWVKTLAAMRDGFASAGVDLLMQLIAVLYALTALKNVSDYVLSEAVATAYVESRGRWNSPIMLLKTVPNVLEAWRAKGRPLDETGDAPSFWASGRQTVDSEKPPPKKKRAVDYI